MNKVAVYKNCIILLILFLLQVGCDPILYYEYQIHNESDRTFQIGYSGFGLEYERLGHDSIITIDAKSKSMINFDMWGSHPHDEGANFLSVFDTIYVVNADTIGLLKDIQKRESWSYDNDIIHFGLIKTGTNIYLLKLNNEDFRE
jgi:hypothetical protein